MVQLGIQHLLFIDQLLDYCLPLVYLLAHHLLDVLVLLPKHSQRNVLVLDLPLPLAFLLLQMIKLPLQNLEFRLLLDHLLSHYRLLSIECLNLYLPRIKLALASIDSIV